MTIALITGGSRGLGRNAAVHLARRGVHAILTYRSNEAAAREAVAAVEAEGARAEVLRFDAGDAAAIPAFVEEVRAALGRLGADRLDILYNNAGDGTYAPFADTPEADLDRMLAVHVKGPFMLTQALLPLIRDGGRILNVSSGLVRFSLPGYAAYAMAKGAVEVMTRYLARELGARGISANTLAPGAIETDFGGGAVRDVPEVNRMIAGLTAMGRAGLPDDIGGAVAAILTSESNWMTGQRIEVSGGQAL